MSEETTTARTPDTDRTDDGIGRPINTSCSSSDELGNPSRTTTRNDSGPDCRRDCRRDPDFGYGGSNGNSPLF